MMRKERDEAGNMNCVICLEKQRDTVVIPCNHLCLCSACRTVAAFPKCPVCRTKVEKLIKIYT
jgi:hypothetical protein